MQFLRMSVHCLKVFYLHQQELPKAWRCPIRANKFQHLMTRNFLAYKLLLQPQLQRT